MTRKELLALAARCENTEVVRFVARSSRSRFAFTGDTKSAACDAVRRWAAANRGRHPLWRTLAREGWRVSKVTSTEKENP